MTTMTVTTADDLLSIIPSLIGKYPTAGESVIVLIRDGQIALCARQDNEGMCSTDPDMFAAYMSLAVANAGATQYIFIGYMDDPNDQSLYPYAFALQQYAEMLDVLVVGNEQYTNMRENEVFDLPSATTILDKEPILDRKQLFDAFDGKPYRTAKAVMKSTLSTLKDASGDLVDRYVLMAQAEQLKDGELVCVGSALMHMRVRDTLLYDIGGMGASECMFMYDRMAHIASLMPGKYKASPATIAAVAAYLAGDGMRANVAIEVALGFDPEHSLAKLVGEFIARALPPYEMRSMLQAFTRSVLIAP